MGTMHDLCAEGLTPAFLGDAHGRIEALILPRAEAYFREGGTPASQESPSLKALEQVVNFYDYQPCAVSVLSAIARRGDGRALALVRRIWENARYYFETFRECEGIRLPLRRSLLHLALSYGTLATAVSENELSGWRELLVRAAEDLVGHFDGFRERAPSLDNRAFGTGINHVAIAAEGIWKCGEVLGRADWRTMAGDFVDRLVAYGHPDGYFEENTNDTREGGPSLAYTPLTAGCAYLVKRWGGNPERERFARCGSLYRNLTSARLQPLPFADERANPQGIRAHRPYGRALHSLTPEGRGFLRLWLDPSTGICPLEALSLEHLARLDLELREMETGKGDVPEPCREGTFRIGLPLGVIRRDGWTMGLSALRALNREIGRRGDYALDRQSLVCLSHVEAGTVLAGAKSKHDVRWSTVRIGDDAYPVRTGELRVESDRMAAEVHYKGFSVQATWIAGEAPHLVMTSNALGSLVTRLPLEIEIGSIVRLDREREIRLSEKETTYRSVKIVATEAWEVRADRPGDLEWPIAPFDPYSEGNVGSQAVWRPVLSVEWRDRIEFVFQQRAAGR